MNSDFPAGVIEGYFGAPWPPEKRLAFVGGLPALGLDFYIYAPKNDPFLRRRWEEPPPAEHAAALADLREKAAAAGVAFGVGLSPLGAAARGRAALPAFREKTKLLLRLLEPDRFALLFDDMKISHDREGELQNMFVKECADLLAPSGARLAVCGSFYSTDPILEKVFGKMPENYFRDLTAEVPDEVDFFWTGRRVISPDYAPADLAEAERLLGRPPFIWDNYPVNDGKAACGHLYLRPFAGREAVPAGARGLAANPMRQTLLNRVPLASLRAALGPGGPAAVRRAAAGILARIYPPEFAAFAARRADLFAETPLGAIPPETIEEIRAELRAVAAAPGAAACAAELREIADFLAGEYAFDPACLTG